MKTNSRTSNLVLTLAAAMTTLAVIATSANASVIVDGSKVQGVPTFAVQGTLLAIDGPQSDQVGNISAPQGPDWADDADDGWELLGGTIFAENNRVGWEPDGNGGTNADVRTGSFVSAASGNQARWTFDVPDGSIIHNVYARWNHQANAGSGHTYSYDEGVLTQFVRAGANSINDLSLEVLPSNTGPQNISFERIFAGDITVADGDGFAVTFDAASGFANIDAVVIDVTLAAAGTAPEPSTLILAALGLVGLVGTRRRNR